MNVMKYRIVSFLCSLLLICCVFAGCKPEGVPSYAIGREYKYDGFSIRADIEVEEERFVITYKNEKNYKYSHIFYFIFTYATCNILYKSTEFEYKESNGNEIAFDEDGHFYFEESKVIYVSYKYANQEIKTAIMNEKFEIEFGCGTFTIYTYDVE